MPTFTLELSDEIDNCLTQIAQRNCITKAEAMKRAFALLAIADDQKQLCGGALGLIRERDDHTFEVMGRVTGL